MQYSLSNGQSVIIRAPEVGDAAALLTTFQQIVSETNFLLTTVGEARQQTLRSEQDFIRSFRNNPNNLFLIAVVEKQIVATLSVTQSNWKKQAHTAEFGIAVLQRYWNMGIARRMMTHMFRWLEDKPVIEMLFCKVMANNEKALHLYKSFDFAEQACLEKFFRQPDNEYVDLVYMVKWMK